MYRQLVTFVKGMQEYDNPTGLAIGTGWDMMKLSFPIWMHPSRVDDYSSYDQVQRKEVLTALFEAWLDKSMEFTPQQYWGRGIGGPTATVKTSGTNYSGNEGDRLWFTISSLKDLGINAALINKAADFGQSIWQGTSWTPLKIDVNDVDDPIPTSIIKRSMFHSIRNSLKPKNLSSVDLRATVTANLSKSRQKWSKHSLVSR